MKTIQEIQQEIYKDKIKEIEKEILRCIRINQTRVDLDDKQFNEFIMGEIEDAGYNLILEGEDAPYILLEY